MVGLLLMEMPGFHHAREGGGEVDLAELLEPRVVRPQDLAEPAAFVGNHFAATHAEPFDQSTRAANHETIIDADTF